jgi:hypothetical protein
MFVQVTLRGQEDGDLVLAGQEVVRLLGEGYRSGSNRNETGAYSFQVASADDEEPSVDGFFSVADVRQHRPAMTVEEARTFLSRHHQAFEELLVEWGNRLIEELLAGA